MKQHQNVYPHASHLLPRSPTDGVARIFATIFVCGHRPKTKELLVIVVVVLVLLVVLHHLGHFLNNRNLSEKILPSGISNLGPPAHHSSN